MPNTSRLTAQTGKVACLMVACDGLQVNYVGKAANLYEDAGYKLHGSAYVINKYLGTTWLWDRIRVSGGAYGGFSDFDSHSGMFTYLSYRDPNLLKSVDNYDGELCYICRQACHVSDACGKWYCQLVACRQWLC